MKSIRILLLAAALGATASTWSTAQANPVPQSDKKAGKTGIEWIIQPANVVIYLDGKKLGDAANVKFTEAKPGKHAVRLVRGGDETEIDIKVIKGEVLKVEFAFEDG